MAQATVSDLNNGVAAAPPIVRARGDAIQGFEAQMRNLFPEGGSVNRLAAAAGAASLRPQQPRTADTPTPHQPPTPAARAQANASMQQSAPPQPEGRAPRHEESEFGTLGIMMLGGPAGVLAAKTKDVLEAMDSHNTAEDRHKQGMGLTGAAGVKDPSLALKTNDAAPQSAARPLNFGGDVMKPRDPRSAPSPWR